MKHFKNIFLLYFLALNVNLNAQLWPGDVNNNGEVNSFDLLYLGYAYGALGPTRPNASTNWIAQTAAPSWGNQFPTNLIDISYADCDGNGIVEDQDILVINQNYQLTHTVVPDPILVGLPGLDPTVEVKRSTTDTLTPGALEIFEIHLGPSHISNFYGVSFTISYDTAYVDSVVKVLPATGWITNNGQDKVIQVDQEYILPNSANGKDGRIDVAYSRTNGLPVFGTGIVGLFAIIMEDNVNGKLPTDIDFEIEVIDVRMTDPFLNFIPTVPSISNFLIVSDTTTLNNTQNLLLDDKSIQIYPNPASDFCSISSPVLPFNQVEVIDMKGRTIQTHVVENSFDVQIDVNHLPKGIYIIKLFTNKGILLKKLILTG